MNRLAEIWVHGQCASADNSTSRCLHLACPGLDAASSRYMPVATVELAARPSDESGWVRRAADPGSVRHAWLQKPVSSQQPSSTCSHRTLTSVALHAGTSVYRNDLARLHITVFYTSHFQDPRPSPTEHPPEPPGSSQAPSQAHGEPNSEQLKAEEEAMAAIAAGTAPFELEVDIAACEAQF